MTFEERKSSANEQSLHISITGFLLFPLLPPLSFESTRMTHLVYDVNGSDFLTHSLTLHVNNTMLQLKQCWNHLSGENCELESSSYDGDSDNERIPVLVGVHCCGYVEYLVWWLSFKAGDLDCVRFELYQCSH